MSDRVDVLVLTGSMGAGKTTVMGEVSDLLAARAIAHAVARVETLDARLDAALVEGFRVDNDDRVVTDVAREVLRLAKWPID